MFYENKEKIITVFAIVAVLVLFLIYYLTETSK